MYLWIEHSRTTRTKILKTWRVVVSSTGISFLLMGVAYATLIHTSAWLRKQLNVPHPSKLISTWSPLLRMPWYLVPAFTCQPSSQKHESNGMIHIRDQRSFEWSGPHRPSWFTDERKRDQINQRLTFLQPHQHCLILLHSRWGGRNCPSAQILYSYVLGNSL